MESSKIKQKTLLSFFTKQHLNEDPDASASGSGTNSIPLPVTSDDKSGLPITAVSSSSVSSSSATPDIENVCDKMNMSNLQTIKIFRSA
ncbi:hypothetical protein QE152_g34164 [Popillia japonica]|uniref:Uncharacterized protein n=1 Tax=Popillia japonica TaxID=7064 RepID=A0AAW1IUP9_POPJA